MKTTWFITGAGRGLGLHLAWAAAEAGHRVVATGPDRARLTGVLGEDGADLLTLALDLTDPDAAQGAVAAAMRRFGAIDVLVHGASQARMASADQIEDTGLRAHFLADFFGAYNVTGAALPFMQAAGRGLVLHVSPEGAASPSATLVESGPFGRGLVAGTTFSGASPEQLARELVRLAGDEDEPLRLQSGTPANAMPKQLH